MGFSLRLPPPLLHCHSLILSRIKINKSLSKKRKIIKKMKEEINYIRIVDLLVRVLAVCKIVLFVDCDVDSVELVLGKERGQSG